jgi:hypothetical protein
MEGSLAVTWPEIQETLNISPGQNLQIQGILAEVNEFRGRVGETGRTLHGRLFPTDEDRDGEASAKGASKRVPQFARDLDKAQETMKSLWLQADKVEQDAIRRIGRVLTKRQKQAFNKMLGTPFNFGSSEPPSTPAAAPASPSAAGTGARPTPGRGARKR